MKKLIIAMTGALISTTALAQGTTANPVDILTVDTDRSGEVSLVEAQVVWPDLTEEAFKAADTDASGGLNAQELATLPGPGATGTSQ